MEQAPRPPTGRAQPLPRPTLHSSQYLPPLLTWLRHHWAANELKQILNI